VNRCFSFLSQARFASKSRSDVTVVNNVVRWVASNNVPPGDLLDEMLSQDLISFEELVASSRARDEDLQRLLFEMGNRVPSAAEEAEHMAELRAVHPVGTTVVNVFTGKRTVVR
jgi:hypothetical protein